MSPVSSRTIRMSSPRDDLGLQRRGVARAPGSIIAGRRLANRPSSLRRPRIACSGRSARSQRVVLPVADRAEQHRIGAPGELQRRLAAADGRARRSRRRRPAPPRSRSGQVERAQHAHASAHDLGADAVAGEDRDLHECLPRSMPACGGAAQIVWRAIASSARASNARILSAWRSVRPMSSKPSSRQYLRNA